ncbi:hypothetical protein HanRHA438_Chr10g0440901 [Helianthus annuus]|nr:hypothetical protein HanRHA438_Chr10g0440901 [Helianthus annuus]
MSLWISLWVPIRSNNPKFFFKSLDQLLNRRLGPKVTTIGAAMVMKPMLFRKPPATTPVPLTTISIAYLHATTATNITIR